MCVQALYQGLLTRFDVILGTFLKENKIEKVDIAFVTEIYDGVQDNLVELYTKLSHSLKRKKFEYLVTLQKAILYAAAYEYYFKKIDKGILIKEYVLLAKRFFHDDEYKVIHASIHSLPARDSDISNIDIKDDTLNESGIDKSGIENSKINNTAVNNTEINDTTIKDTVISIDDLYDDTANKDSSNLNQIQNDTSGSNNSKLTDNELEKVLDKKSINQKVDDFGQQSVISQQCISQQCIIARQNQLKHISIPCTSNDQILV